jgi:stage II sporulation protein GA (sporulation sigma-E factor processing peptidase)
MMLAGTMFFLLATSGSNFMIMNGFLIINNSLSPQIIILAILICIVFVKVLFKLKKVHAIKERLLVPLIISIDKKNVSMPALIDTGNLLCDPLTNLPVIIAEYTALKDILPEEVLKLINSSKKFDYLELGKNSCNQDWLKRLRLIPFSSLGNDGDILLGFRPDLVEIGDDKKRTTNVIIAIYKNTLSKTQEFQALLGPQLI